MDNYYTSLQNWNTKHETAKKIDLRQAALFSGLDSADAITVANNHKVFTAFVEHALRVVAAGRLHYSARTIIEVMRHESLIADNDLTFKLNNNIALKLARVSMQLFPALNGLFSTRAQQQKEVNLHLSDGGYVA